jgi:formate dehydrogenase subunit gamma
MAHFLVTGTFLFLFLTGSSFLLGYDSFLGESFRQWHPIIGIIFAIGILALALLWAKESIFVGRDREWFVRLGGYLGERVPAATGKFNAGQKLYFWIAAISSVVLTLTGITMYIGAEALRRWLPLAYTLHDIGAILVGVFFIGHLYLGTLANPGRLRAIFQGKIHEAGALPPYQKGA